MNSNFEKVIFNPFQSFDILLNNNRDPDLNFFNSVNFENSNYVTPHEAFQELKQTDCDNFSILHLNVRSMNKNFEDFKSFYMSLKYEFKVICLSETWAENNIENFSTLKIPNYKLIHQERSIKNKGGEVCMFIHNSISFKKLNSFCVSAVDNESLCIEILDNKAKNKIINLTYRPPCGNNKLFQNYLRNFLLNKSFSSKDIYIVGDLNLNLLDYEKNQHVKISYINYLKIT